MPSARQSSTAMGESSADFSTSAIGGGAIVSIPTCRTIFLRAWSVFWPCGTIQPVPCLFVRPAGNGVALGDSDTLGRPQVALGRFGATHRRGVGRSTQSDQQAKGQNRSHLFAPFSQHRLRSSPCPSGLNMCARSGYGSTIAASRSIKSAESGSPARPQPKKPPERAVTALDLPPEDHPKPGGLRLTPPRTYRRAELRYARPEFDSVSARRRLPQHPRAPAEVPGPISGRAGCCCPRNWSRT
jgi:hypothetical protein